MQRLHAFQAKQNPYIDPALSKKFQDLQSLNFNADPE